MFCKAPKAPKLICTVILNPPPPVQEHARVLIYLRVLIFCVFLFLRPWCAVFPAPFVCRNMAELNVDDPLTNCP